MAVSGEEIVGAGELLVVGDEVRSKRGRQAHEDRVL